MSPQQTALAACLAIFASASLISAESLPVTVSGSFASGISLNWPIRKGGWYRIERSVSLAPGTWEEVQRFYAPFSTATTQSGGYDPSTKAHLQISQGGGSTGGNPSTTEPIYFFVIRRDNASTLLSWPSDAEGGVASAYVSQDWRFLSSPNLLPPTASLRITNNGSPYSVSFITVDTTALPTPLPSSSDLGSDDQAYLARITGAWASVAQFLQQPPPPPTVGFTVPSPMQGAAYYRIQETAVDTDDDGIWDWHEWNRSLNPFASDTDGDQVTDPWDGIAPQPIISEFQASNQTTIADEDGVFSDWCEIINPTTAAVSMANWKITDTAGNLSKWIFPSISIPPGKTLLVWLSGKNRTNPANPLHTNFSLEAAAESVRLVTPTGNVVDTFAWSAQNSQLPDRSFGWGITNSIRTPTGAPADGLTRKGYYFGEPTPGTANRTTAYVGICQDPVFSALGGIFESGSINVTVTPSRSGDTVRYTLDSSEPTEVSPTIPTAPLSFTSTRILRAYASAPDCLSSRVVTKSFLFKPSVLGNALPGTIPIDHQHRAALIGPNGTKLVDYSMDPLEIQSFKLQIASQMTVIPTVSIAAKESDLFSLTAGVYSNSGLTESSPDPLDQNWERRCSVEFFNLTPGQRDFENGSITVSGASSLNSLETPKHSFKLRFSRQSTARPNGVLRLQPDPFLPILPERRFESFMLRNPTQDSWCRYSTTGQLPWLLPQATYCKEAWARSMQATMGHLAAHRRWVHLYLNGYYWGVYDFGDRLDEGFLQAYDEPGSEYDVLKGAEAEGPAENGDHAAWNELSDRVVTAVASSGNNSQWAAVEGLLDVNNYIDYIIIQLFMLNEDWPGRNWRAARSRNGDIRSDPNPNNFVFAPNKFRFFIWDTEIAMRHDGLAEFHQPAVLQNIDPTRFHAALLNHPKYVEKFKLRVAMHFQTPGGAFYGNAPMQRLQAAADEFASIFYCESARWGNTSNVPTYYTFSHWSANRDTLLTWLPARRTNFLNLYLMPQGLHP